jgi:hypothetical protein
LNDAATLTLLDLYSQNVTANVPEWSPGFRTFQTLDGLQQASKRFGLREDQIHVDRSTGAVAVIEYRPLEGQFAQALGGSKTELLGTLSTAINGNEFTITPVGNKGAHKVHFLTGVMADYQSGPDIKKPLEPEFQGLRRLFTDVYRPGMTGKGLVELSYIFENKAQAEAFRENLKTLDWERFLDPNYAFKDVSRLAGKYATVNNPRTMVTPAEQKLIRIPLDHDEDFSHQIVRRDLPSSEAGDAERQVLKDLLRNVEPIGAGGAVRVPVAVTIEEADTTLGWRRKFPRDYTVDAVGQRYGVEETKQKPGETRIEVVYQVFPNAQVAERALTIFRQRLIDGIDGKVLPDILNGRSGTEASHRVDRLLRQLESDHLRP